MSVRQLPIPPHFDPETVGEVWRVDYEERARDAEAWAEQQDITRAHDDELRVGLLAVDCQNTFCLPDFELFVAGRSGTGAIDDSGRLCQFIYRNLGLITEINITLDTHTPIQIFHPVFWVDEDGEHPAGGQTIITPEDVEEGVWRPNPTVADVVADGDYDWLQRYVHHYVNELSTGEKYPLMVWPYHVILGGIGHALVSALDEAFYFHSVARKAETRFEVKGDNPLTEHYSALNPEVLTGPDGEVIAEKNEAFVERLLGYDMLIIAGQAQSHCVAWTVSDLLSEIEARDAALARKVYLLEDCTSPVVVPDGPDFTGEANEAFERFSAAGMHVVRSADPIEDWPDVNL